MTAGFTHGAYCLSGPCTGTAEQCRQVLDCSQVRSFVFERVFAIGEGDVASAAASIYDLRGEALGRLSGRVIDGKNGKPVSQADVFVYPVPETMADCQRGGDSAEPYTAGPEGFLALCLEARDFDGSISHLRTDKAADALEEGRFDGWVPPGRYYLLANRTYRPASRVVEVTVADQGHAKATLQLMPPAKLRFEIRDANNQRVPAKLTVGQCLPNCAGRFEDICDVDEDCVEGHCAQAPEGVRRCLVDNCPEGKLCNLSAMRCETIESCGSDDDCEPMETCQTGHCVCHARFKRLAALAEGSYKPGVARYSYTADGVGEVELVPGVYDVWASRGFEYSVDKQQVQLLSGHTEEATFRIAQVVDTEGWISGDFHVHGQNSYDAVVKHRDRVMCFAGEGVDMLSTSDHDYITDLSPYVRELGLEKWLTTQVGLELTTVELGHWLAFPLAYKEFEGGERLREQGAVDWTGKPPEQLMQELRQLGEFGPEETVVVVAHPRDSFFGYFDQFGMNHYNPSEIKGSLFETFPGKENPLAMPEQFSGNFDALELFNSKRFEMIRTPTAGEIRDYSQARAIIQDQARLDLAPDEIERQLVNLDLQFVKDILERTPAEQDAQWEADGSAECNLKPFCVSDADCDDGQVCEMTEMLCIQPCATDADCGGAVCSDGRCDPGWTAYGEPCTSFEGMVDEWFRLIDYGVVRTGMGNSDSHKLFTQTEGGLPRNFIRSEAERAKGIDRLDVARSIKAGKLVASYGPFIEAWLGNAGIGDTLEPTPDMSSIPLRIRVQSPGWFDVDRVEVYRSGRLVHVFTGAGDELDSDSTADVSGLRLPNRSVVNLDVTVEEPVPEEDSWYVVIAMGLHGRDMSPIYSEHPYLKLQIGDILSRSFNSVPLMASMGISLASIPRVFRVYPYAVANPVFIDVDGGGYNAPHPTPDWADGPLATQSQALSSPLAPATDAQTFQKKQLRHFMALLHRVFEGL